MRKYFWNQLTEKLMLSFIILSLGVTAYAQIPIGNARDLEQIRENLGGNYVQTADIDLSEIRNWLPLGDDRAPFTGTYNGNGHRIINMSIDRTEDRLPVGFFGYVSGVGALVSNLGLENVDVNGSRPVGGLVGSLEEGGTIMNCYVSGSVIGMGSAGSLIGSMYGRDTAPRIANSYAVGSVTGENDTGGLVGANSGGTIANSYAAVFITGPVAFAGGLVGFRGQGGEIRDSYWDTEASGVTESQGGVGYNTAQMLQQGSFRGWDFRETWAIVQDETYPYLAWQREPGEHNFPDLGAAPPSNLVAVPGNNVVNLSWEPPSMGVWVSFNLYKNNERLANLGAEIRQYQDNEVVNYNQYEYYVTAVWEDESESRASNIVIAVPHEPFAGGDGSVDNPYQIATARQLSDMRYQMNAHFIQIADINLGVPPWNEGTGWQRIGYYESVLNNRPFSGEFNGNGFVIDGLTIIAPEERYTGFFGYLKNASIRHVIFENVIVVANQDLGTLAYKVEGENNLILDVIVTGEVEARRIGTTGGSIAGGIVGSHDGGDIVACHFYGTLTGYGNIGGIAGLNSSFAGEIRACRVEATIVGAHQFIAGIVARNSASVIDCHYFGNITGGVDTGGITGWNYGFITRSSAVGNLNCTAYQFGGIASKNWGTAQITYSYVDMNMSGRSTFGGIVGVHGDNNNMNVLISNCYVRGTIVGNDEAQSMQFGGLVGHQYGNIINSYSTARVTGRDMHRGGLVGRRSGGNTTNSYWDTETSGLNVSASGLGRLTGQMTYPYDGVTYVNWDFAEIWNDDVNEIGNDGYPMLFWQEIPALIDAPVVSVTIREIEGVDHSILSWEAVEGARSYRIYVNYNPYEEDWGHPVSVVEEPGYQEPVNEAGERRFYRVVASMD